MCHTCGTKKSGINVTSSITHHSHYSGHTVGDPKDVVYHFAMVDSYPKATPLRERSIPQLIGFAILVC